MAAKKTTKKAAAADSNNLRIEYDTRSAQYASQVILNAHRDEILVDFSSGIIPDTDPNSNERILPIHTRIALTKLGAERLHSLLGRALEGDDK